MHPFALTLTTLILATTLPAASAAAASAAAFPPSAAPGQTITLVYTVNTTALVEASVLESATCAIAGPDGASRDCGSDATLVDARVQGGERSYTFVLSAPSAPGNYTVTFGRGGTVDLALPPQDASAATAVFRVVNASLSKDTASGPQGSGTDGMPPPSNTGGPALGGPFSGPSALRYLASLFMASGATVAAVFVGRRGA